jgi:hypothetical protein
VLIGLKSKQARWYEIIINKRRHKLDNKTSLESNPEKVLASLSPDTMDRLADLVVAKLQGKKPSSVLPKQPDQ